MTLAEADIKRLSSLLDEVLDLPVEGQEAWLQSLPADAMPLLPTLRGMLARRAAMETGDLAAPAQRWFVQAAAPPAMAGQAVGPYRLLRELGAGGMGTVWLAERADGLVQRQVALKLPHVGWTAGLAERFAREREILATLEHPNIARLYDVGVDAQGRPYMALEYVEGQPIDAYCQRRALAVGARLKLLLQVADAVAFAHGRLVLHRDLKPANILVTEAGQVKLLDFGIAKLMSEGATTAPALTQVAGRALSLAYASPEQVLAEAIGTASDVYSLGVVAFELLVGRRPYKLQRGSAAELEEAITRQEPPLASALAEAPELQRQLRSPRRTTTWPRSRTSAAMPRPPRTMPNWRCSGCGAASGLRPAWRLRSSRRSATRAICRGAMTRPTGTTPRRWRACRPWARNAMRMRWR